PLMDVFEEVSETGIIDLSSRVALTLPALLIVGAVMSQFSAAVADTIGSGGLVEEISGGRVARRVTYAGVAVLVILLVWSANIFEVIAYASRAFAFYYAIECSMAALHAGARGEGRWRLARAGLYVALAVAMAITAVFGIPADSGSGG
ncbi:MAG TPA: hypothetical protein VKB65_03540, partial [Myxococcota bacterium]|nr:hypothetical protein [Myxococcota bacterium]